MKGIVFTEFLEMVDRLWGPEVTDHIIENAELSTGGAYTSVGTYNHSEMVQLVRNLGERTGLSNSQLLETFGEHLFERLAEAFPQLVSGAPTALDLLNRIESVIHPEVRKLYPDAELPRFETMDRGEDHLKLLYRSPRGLADLAHGLIRGCGKWYDEPLHIRREDLSNGANTTVRFVIQRSG